VMPHEFDSENSTIHPESPVGGSLLGQ